MRSHSAMGQFCMKSTQFYNLIIDFLPGAIPSSGISHLPFVGPVSPSISAAQPSGRAITVPTCPVNNLSKTSAFQLSTSTHFSSFSPIGSTKKDTQQDQSFQDPLNSQLPSTLPWPFPPGLSLALPSHSQNGNENEVEPSTPSPPSLPQMSHPRLIRSHSAMGNCIF